MLKTLAVHGVVALSVLLSGASDCQQGEVRQSSSWRVHDKVKTKSTWGTTYFVVVKDQNGRKKSVSLDHIEYVNCHRGDKFHEGFLGGHC